MAQRRNDRVLDDVGRRIAEVRTSRGWTQEHLAERLRVSAKYVQSVERGLENLTLQTLSSFAKVLDTSLPALVRRPLTERRVGRPSKESKALPFEEIEPAPHELYRRCVPLVTLEARAGSLEEARAVETASWVVPKSKAKLMPGMFVARVLGDSMVPDVPAGSWALFRAAPQLPPSGSVVLAQHRESDDPDDAGAFLVKRFEVRREHPLLVSRKRGVPPVLLHGEAGEGWSVIAVLVEVLGA